MLYVRVYVKNLKNLNLCGLGITRRIEIKFGVKVKQKPHLRIIFVNIDL